MENDEVNAMPSLDCLPRETLKDYLSGWVDAEQSDVIEAHLLQCQPCEQTLVELERDPDTLVGYIKSGGPGEGTNESNEKLPDASESGGQPAEGNSNAMAEALSQVKRLLPSDEATATPWRPASDQIGPYTLLQPLGHGGMGSVFLAKHQQLGKQVAIKLLPERPFRNDHYAARFQREIRAAGQLHHPAIVSATDAGHDGQTHYLAMEFIDGLDLSQLARATGPLPVADACGLMHQVALGLSHAHAEGIVHRDVKPSNLMLSRGGEVKILDFGLAQVSLWDEVSAQLTTVGQLMGTLDYMAPEQAERADAVDYRADLYSLGATLFRLLCGRPPLAAAPDLSPLARLRLLATAEPPRLDTLRPDAPPALVEFTASLLARQPTDRPASAAHAAEQLAEFCTGANFPALISRAETNRAARRGEPDSLVSGLSHAMLATATQETKPTMAAATTRAAATQNGEDDRRRAWWMLAAFAPMLALLAVAGVMITIETQKGLLVIESEDANVELNVLRDGEFYESLKVAPGTTTTKLYAGNYEVVIAQGSDAFELDQGALVIKRGESRIARVLHKSPTSPEIQTRDNQDVSATTLPSSNTALQPGDELHVVSRTDASVDTRAIVMADGVIKLPFVGLVETKGKDPQQLEQELNGRYAAIMKDPAIEVYRDFSPPPATPSSKRSAGQALTVESPAFDSGSELLYDGKSLAVWLDLFSRERSPEAIDQALSAMSNLVTEDSRQVITQAILKTLPNLPNGALRIGPDKTPVDRFAFSVLKSCSGDASSYSDLLLDQLESGDRNWTQRILSNVEFCFSDADPGLDPLIVWLEREVFTEGSRYQEFAVLVAERFETYIQRNPLSDVLKQQLVDILVHAKPLGNAYWLSRSPNRRSFATGVTFDSPRLVFAIKSKALEVLEGLTNEPQEIAQAAIMVSFFIESNGERNRNEGIDRGTLSAALSRRLSELSSDLEHITSLERVAPLDLGRSPTRPWVGDPPPGMIAFSYRSTNHSNRANVALELMRLVKELGLQYEAESAVMAVAEATVQSAYQFTAKAKATDVDQISYTLPSMSISVSRLRGRTMAQTFEAFEPTQEESMATIVFYHAHSLLTQEQQASLEERFGPERDQLIWETRIRALDSDGNEKLSFDEAHYLLAPSFSRPIQYSHFDSDQDNLLSKAELEKVVDWVKEAKATEAAMRVSNAQLEWSKRQIAKYDTDGDGKLSQEEGRKMLVNPTGADADQDGFITVEEYAKFRRQN